VTQTIEEKNKAFVLEAFETLFQQEGLRRCGAFLVSELHSAQRAHSAGTRGPLRVGQGHTRQPPLRERAYRRQRRLRAATRPVHRHGSAGELDRGGYRAPRERPTCRALGRHRRRSDEGSVR
jgi:hypothetical protein